MKKNNLLKTVLLLMFSALLLIGCRDETVSIVKQEHSEITKDEIDRLLLTLQEN